jgi:hypothetical protein
VGLCEACNLDGTKGFCTFAAAETDPANECPDDGVSSCGLNGYCDGAGACKLYVSGTPCAEQACLAGVQTSERTCDGSGTCSEGTTTACSPYSCDASEMQCETSCSGPDDCAPDFTCSAPTCTEATPYTPLSSGELRVYYATAEGVSHRIWLASTHQWSSPVSIATPANPVRFAVPSLAPGNGSEALALAHYGSMDDETLVLPGTLDLVAGASGWPVDFSASALPGPFVQEQGPYGKAVSRSYDLAAETVSNHLLTVFSDGTESLKFATREGEIWSAEQSVFESPPGTGVVQWVSLVSHPTADEIALVYSDAAHELFAVIWDGTVWETATASTLETVEPPHVLGLPNGLGLPDFAVFAAAYEQETGELLVVWTPDGGCGGKSDPLRYSTKPNGNSQAFSAPAQKQYWVAAAGPMVAASEPGTSRIAVAVIEYGCGGTIYIDFSVTMWDGTEFKQSNDLCDVNYNIGDWPGGTPTAVAWYGAAAVAAFARGAGDTGKLSWATWTDSAGWMLQAAAAMDPPIGIPASMEFARIPPLTSGSPDDLALIIQDENGMLWAKRYDGTSWSDMNDGSPLATGLWLTPGQPFGIVAR